MRNAYADPAISLDGSVNDDYGPNVGNMRDVATIFLEDRNVRATHLHNRVSRPTKLHGPVQTLLLYHSSALYRVVLHLLKPKCVQPDDRWNAGGVPGDARRRREMSTRLIRQMLSAKVDPERWLVLIKRGLNHWNFRVVGPEPLDVELVALTDHEAKNHALSMAQQHFREVNPKVVVTRFQRWRTALSADRMLPTG
jgi:hypothetical protein